MVMGWLVFCTPLLRATSGQEAQENPVLRAARRLQYRALDSDAPSEGKYIILDRFHFLRLIRCENTLERGVYLLQNIDRK